MVIRKADKKDLISIMKLNNELFELELAEYDMYLVKNWPLSEEGKKYFSDAIKNDVVFVAEIDGEVVGYVLGRIANIPYYSFALAELCNMCVQKEFRCKGIGRDLVQNLIDHFKSIGIDKFIVTASFKNKYAKEFYKKLGFVESNITFVKFD